MFWKILQLLLNTLPKLYYNHGFLLHPYSTRDIFCAICHRRKRGEFIFDAVTFSLLSSSEFAYYVNSSDFSTTPKDNIWKKYIFRWKFCRFWEKIVLKNEIPVKFTQFCRKSVKWIQNNTQTFLRSQYTFDSR